jgi:pimeloyl-ACP methyl ester carboxylesterase
MVKDLHDVLEATEAPGPYVMVGQSFAGMKVRLFTYQYPDEVVGMVLVDADHEDMTASDLSVLPPPSPGESESLKDIRKELANPGSTQDPSVNYPDSYEQMHVTGSLGDMPLIVLTAGQNPPPLDLEPEVAQLLNDSWLRVQEQQARLSTNSQHIIVEDSGHNIHLDSPQTVVQAIGRVIESRRTGMPLSEVTP